MSGAAGRRTVDVVVTTSGARFTRVVTSVKSDQYLFVYGTLLRDTAPPAIAGLCRRFRRVGDATVKGVLYDLGNYPALATEGAGESDYVKGEVVCVGCAADWLRLDTYEGCDHAHPERSLYRRVRTAAMLDNGQTMDCWVYVYNRELKDVPRIEPGCWRTHLSEEDDVDVIVIPC